jgi:CheY-like chemotaxis protein
MSTPHSWLLVEDNEDEFILLQRALRRTIPEVRLLWVSDGLQAKDYLLGRSKFEKRSLFPLPSVVLADLKMPRCNGLELLQWIRGQSELRTLPVVILSSSDQPSDVTSAYEFGANWYLTKPSTLDKLAEVLTRLHEQFRDERTTAPGLGDQIIRP